MSQTCDSDGMEFTLRIPEGFWGRIYTHNHYGRWVNVMICHLMS